MQKKEYTQEEIDKIFADLHAGPIGRRTEAQWDSSFRLSQPKSEETKLKISSVHKGKKISAYQTQKIKQAVCKPIIATNIVTGQSIRFESQAMAADTLNMLSGNINNVLKGKFKQNKGYTFTYA